MYKHYFQLFKISCNEINKLRLEKYFYANKILSDTLHVYRYIYRFIFMHKYKIVEIIQSTRLTHAQ